MKGGIGLIQKIETYDLDGKKSIYFQSNHSDINI